MKRALHLSRAAGTTSVPAREFIKAVRRLFEWVIGCLLLACFMPAHATPTCTFGALSMNPPAPSRIEVTSSVPAGKVIYSTTMSSTFSCTGGANGNYIVFTSQVLAGTTHTVSGVTNVSVTSTLSTTPPGASYGYLTGLTSVTGSCSLSGYYSSNKPMLKFTGPGACSGTVGLGLTFFATATGAVSGTIPSALAGYYSTTPGWLLALNCTDSTCNVVQFGSAGTANGPSIPIQSTASTCTLATPANMVVTLPTISQTSFTGIGSTSGATKGLTIQYNCSNAGGPMALSMAWTFASPGQTPSSYATVVNNSGTATGVGVQIVDAAGNPIVSGAQSQQIASVANGTNTIAYTVRYSQTAATVGPGTVSATAQFTAVYN